MEQAAPANRRKAAVLSIGKLSRTTPVLYHRTAQTASGRRSSRNGYLGVVVRVYYYPLRLSSMVIDS